MLNNTKKHKSTKRKLSLDNSNLNKKSLKNVSKFIDLNSQKSSFKKIEQKKLNAKLILRILKKKYPNAHCGLYYKNPFQLLVATILSARCTDKRVNLVTPKLFRIYPNVSAFAVAKQKDLENIIRSTGFFRNKSKNIRLSAGQIEKYFNGKVPNTMSELLTLPGVARKTANVVLFNAFGKNEGIVVDTHVKCITNRLDLAKANTPQKIELELMEIFPQAEWGMLSHYLIAFGRDTCRAINPHCDNCKLRLFCKYKNLKKAKNKNN